MLRSSASWTTCAAIADNQLLAAASAAPLDTLSSPPPAEHTCKHLVSDTESSSLDTRAQPRVGSFTFSVKPPSFDYGFKPWMRLLCEPDNACSVRSNPLRDAHFPPVIAVRKLCKMVLYPFVSMH